VVGRREIGPISEARETRSAHNGMEGRGHLRADRSIERLTMKRRKIDPRRAKIHRNYTVEETARLFSVHRNTVRAWLRSGLKAIDSTRPTLIHGSELCRFLKERRAQSKRPTPPGMIYCLGCRAHRQPAGNMVDYLPLTVTSGNLQGICPGCEKLIYRRANFAALNDVCAGLEVTIKEPDLRLRQCKEPSLNHDSAT
jgi:hypothetical protein